MIWQHGVIYHQEYNYKLNFEANVNRGLVDFAEQFRLGKDHVWICEHRGRVIGTLFLQHHGLMAQLRYFQIHPDYRGLGFGKRLINLFMERLDRTGCRSCYLLTTPEQERATAVYLRYGFKLTEEKHAIAVSLANRSKCIAMNGKNEIKRNAEKPHIMNDRNLLSTGFIPYLCPRASNAGCTRVYN